MPRTLSQTPDDPFDGLLLPISAWKALEAAKITSLGQLKAVAPQLRQIRGMDPEAAQVIADRLDRLAARRTVRVRLIFPKQPHPKNGTQGEPEAGGDDAHSSPTDGGRSDGVITSTSFTDLCCFSRECRALQFQRLGQAGLKAKIAFNRLM